MRRLLTFPCAGETLAATLDEAPGRTGLLIVSGGNELRCGAHRGMALLAAALAKEGVPVFRYDRRGIGDSSGENSGFAQAGADLRDAAAAFRRESPGVVRIVAYGNCDAATLLALEGDTAGIDGLVLSNPWTGDQPDPLPPAPAIRAHYARTLRRPAEWRRLLRGGVSLPRLVAGLRKIAAPPPRDGLAERLAARLAHWGDRATMVLARQDATAIAFAGIAEHPRTIRIDTGSHSFARAADGEALAAAIRAALIPPLP